MLWIHTFLVLKYNTAPSFSSVRSREKHVFYRSQYGECCIWLAGKTCTPRQGSSTVLLRLCLWAETRLLCVATQTINAVHQTHSSCWSFTWGKRDAEQEEFNLSRCRARSRGAAAICSECYRCVDQIATTHIVHNNTANCSLNRNLKW